MVLPFGVAAAQAAGAGATAFGLSMSKTDLELTRDLFKLQMRQSKRLWTADYAENAVRHAEQCMQAAQQHQEAQAMSTAAYYQAEKLASQGMKLARDQDSRAYEMSWRAEVRESLRDELQNQNNRFNMIMLCDTVCLSCVFSLVADSGVPENSDIIMLNLYVLCLGLSITLFTISLWCAVIVVRRLHEHTAAILERKLFSQSEDLRKVWEYQLTNNLPTGPKEIHLVNQAYEQWLAQYLEPLGKCSINMLSIGVVGMFVTAGLLTHLRYLIEFQAISVVIIFWSTVAVTSFTVITMKIFEDSSEKRKIGVYDNSWQDQSTLENGPFAKINRAAEQLFSTAASELASMERAQSLSKEEQIQRNLCVETKSLHHLVKSLRNDAESRAKIRKDVLQLLTTAAEELDALPEELTSGLNKILHTVDEADSRLANVVNIEPEKMQSLTTEASERDWTGLRRKPPRQPMSIYPIDAQRMPVSLVSLRRKLGEISLTSLLRIKNLSNEPLRLKSGVHLKEGRYILSLNAIDPSGTLVCHHLYPGTEIPPRTEAIIVARSNGGWVPTSGISGKIVYMNRDESWRFCISFCNELVGGVRRCGVEASHQSSGDGTPTNDSKQNHPHRYWQISREELDRKANNEVVISIDALDGEEAEQAELDHRKSSVSLKSGILLKNKSFGLRLQWQKKWFELTPAQLTYSQDPSSSGYGGGSEKMVCIPVQNIASVRVATDIKNGFEIHTITTADNSRGPYRLSASSPEERDDWMQKISRAAGVRVAAINFAAMTESSGFRSSTTSVREGIECVQSPLGETELFPV